MFEYFLSKRAVNTLLWETIRPSSIALEEVKNKNDQFKEKIHKKFLKSQPSLHQQHMNQLLPEGSSSEKTNTESKHPTEHALPPAMGRRGIVFDESIKSPEDIDLKDIWSLYDPWMSLALDTSLSIKFIPTVKKPIEEGINTGSTDAVKENPTDKEEK